MNKYWRWKIRRIIRHSIVISFEYIEFVGIERNLFHGNEFYFVRTTFICCPQIYRRYLKHVSHSSDSAKLVSKRKYEWTSAGKTTVGCVENRISCWKIFKGRCILRKAKIFLNEYILILNRFSLRHIFRRKTTEIEYWYQPFRY